MIQGVVFDIDDTLYLERDYVRSGFLYVARHVAATVEEAREIADWLWRAFERGVRGDTFDQLLAARPDLAARVTAIDLIAAYRSHVPTISLLPGMQEVLDDLSAAGLRLGVLSDGPIESQRAKAEALGLDAWFDPVLLTAARGRGFAKPGTLGFEWIASSWRLPHPELAYVADNPLKDFRGPRRLGWRTIRLRLPPQLRQAIDPIDEIDGPDVEVDTPADIVGQLV